MTVSPEYPQQSPTPPQPQLASQTPGPQLYAYAPQPPMDGLAIAAFVCSLCGLALIPIILGHISLSRIKKQNLRGSAFAIVGLVLGYLQAVAYIIVAIVLVSASIWALNS